MEPDILGPDSIFQTIFMHKRSLNFIIQSRKTLPSKKPIIFWAEEKERLIVWWQDNSLIKQENAVHWPASKLYRLLIETEYKLCWSCCHPKHIFLYIILQSGACQNLYHIKLIKSENDTHNEKSVKKHFISRWIRFKYWILSLLNFGNQA